MIAKSNREVKRNSSIELLKLIAILLIVVCHSLPNGVNIESNSVIDLNLATSSIDNILLLFFANMGQIGNDVFLICSVWFLIDSKKINSKKMACIIGDCFIISNIMLIVFLALGYDLPAKYILKQIFPTTFGGNWYITCYLLLYFMHPLLNIIIGSLEKKTLLRVNLLLALFYCVIIFIDAKELLFYNELIGFIVIYFFVSYIKKYLNEYVTTPKIAIFIIIIGVFGWFSQNLITNFLGLKIELLSNNNLVWNKLTNPCYIMIAVGLFGLMSSRTFYNKFINFVSGMSLLIYVIHCNRIIRDYVRYDVFEWIYNNHTYDNLLLWVLLYAFLSLVFGLVCAVLYKVVLQKIVTKISTKILEYMNYIYIRLEKAILKL